MDKQKILIADADDVFPLALTQLLRERYEVRCCQSGKHTLELLHSYQPDLLVLELMLPELDGISLLQSAVASGLKLNVLVISCLCNEYTMEILGPMGIRYAIRKPCDLNAAVNRITDLIRQPNTAVSIADMRQRILTLLHTLNFSPKHDGYTYLQEAIAEMARNPGQSITKELYPTVASICGCTRSQVERCIRTAISAAWKATDYQLWMKIFDLDPNTAPKRPTNTEFIVRCVEILR